MDTPLTPGQRQGNWIFANSLALLILRLVLGWTFIFHGSQKLFGAFSGSGMEPVIQMTQHFNFPLFSATVWAYMAALGEFVGGVLVFLGLLTRLGAIPIIVTMCVAIAEVHGPIGFSSPPPGLPGYEFNLALIAIGVSLVLAGGGLISLDALLFKRGLWARGPQPLDQPIKR